MNYRTTEHGAFKARKLSWCATCGQRITVGDYILGGPGGYIHDVCPTTKEVMSQASSGELVRLVATEFDTVRIETGHAGKDGEVEYKGLIELPAVMLRRLRFNAGRRGQ